MAVRVTIPTEAELAELADVAARTFPLACPPTSTPDNIAAFIDESLSEARFAEYAADPDRVLLVARDDQRMLGYAMLLRGTGDDPDVEAAVTVRPAVELSKMYVLPASHGAGVSAVLMRESLTRAADLGVGCVWLGVNQQNLRAQRFYGKHGFAVNGTKTFRLGAHLEHDYVMVRPL